MLNFIKMSKLKMFVWVCVHSSFVWRFCFCIFPVFFLRPFPQYSLISKFRSNVKKQRFAIMSGTPRKYHNFYFRDYIRPKLILCFFGHLMVIQLNLTTMNVFILYVRLNNKHISCGSNVNVNKKQQFSS